MTKDIPEINELLQGINDSDDFMESPSPTIPECEETEEKELSQQEHPGTTIDDKCWDRFMAHLNQTVDSGERDDRLVCKIDRDLADSLDDCDIGNRCRSDLVNAIVRAFFETYITRLLKFRREKKSLFRKFKTD